MALIKCKYCKSLFPKELLKWGHYCPECYGDLWDWGKNMTLFTKCKRCGVELTVKGKTKDELDREVKLCPACLDISLGYCGLTQTELLTGSTAPSTDASAITVVNGFNRKTINYYNRELVLLSELKELCVEK